MDGQDTRAHAEAAKESLDMYVLKGRPIRVRYATHGAALRVKELSPYVSNELLDAVCCHYTLTYRVACTNCHYANYVTHHFDGYLLRQRRVNALF